jgi:biopolymer transport protein TolR
MAMSVSSGRSSVRAEPNVTPMIDVMLVLLIIFMIIIPTITSGFNAQPPTGQNIAPHPEADQDQVLGIDANGQYYLNRNALPNAELQQKLTAIYANRTEDTILYVKADKNLDYGKVLDAMDVAAKAGVRKAAMVTDQIPGTLSKIPSDNISPTAMGGKK